MIKYIIESQGIRKEISDKEDTKKLTTELTERLQELYKTETPKWINSSTSYGSTSTTFGYWDPWGDNLRHPYLDIMIQRSADIIRKKIGVSEIIKYTISQTKRENKKIIYSETENEPEDCWIKYEYDLMREKVEFPDL